MDSFIHARGSGNDLTRGLPRRTVNINLTKDRAQAGLNSETAPAFGPTWASTETVKTIHRHVGRPVRLSLIDPTTKATLTGSMIQLALGTGPHTKEQRQLIEMMARALRAGDADAYVDAGIWLCETMWEDMRRRWS